MSFYHLFYKMENLLMRLIVHCLLSK